MSFKFLNFYKDKVNEKNLKVVRVNKEVLSEHMNVMHTLTFEPAKGSGRSEHFQESLYFEKHQSIVCIRFSYELMIFHIPSSTARYITPLNSSDPYEDGYESEEVDITHLAKINEDSFVFGTEDMLIAKYTFRDPEIKEECSESSASSSDDDTAETSLIKKKANIVRRRDGYEQIYYSHYGMDGISKLNDDMLVSHCRDGLVVIPHNSKSVEPVPKKDLFNPRQPRDGVSFAISKIHPNQIYVMMHTRIVRQQVPPSDNTLKPIKRINFSDLKNITVEKEIPSPSDDNRFIFFDIFEADGDREFVICIDARKHIHVIDPENEKTICVIDNLPQEYLDLPSTTFFRILDGKKLLFVGSRTNSLEEELDYLHCFDLSKLVKNGELKLLFSKQIGEKKEKGRWTRSAGIVEMKGGETKNSFSIFVHLDRVAEVLEISMDQRTSQLEREDLKERSSFVKEMVIMEMEEKKQGKEEDEEEDGRFKISFKNGDDDSSSTIFASKDLF